MSGENPGLGVTALADDSEFAKDDPEGGTTSQILQPETISDDVLTTPVSIQVGDGDAFSLTTN